MQNINIHPAIEEYCKGFGLKLFGIIPNLPSMIGLEFSSSSDSDNVWLGYDTDSSDFLYNIGIILFLVFGSLLIALLMFILLMISKYCISCLVKLLQKILGQFKWNFFLRAVIQCFLSITSASFLSLKIVSLI